jgi:hypothetical protein
MGQRASDTRGITFEDVEVPEENVYVCPLFFFLSFFPLCFLPLCPLLLCCSHVIPLFVCVLSFPFLIQGGTLVWERDKQTHTEKECGVTLKRHHITSQKFYFN